MKRLALAILLLLASCSDIEVTKIVRGPDGVTAKIRETRLGASASNRVEISLLSADGSKKTSIFEATGGSDPNVYFLGRHLIVVKYCWPTRYKVKGYIYSLGDDYRFSDVRITAATVDSQIGTLRFCELR